MWNYSGMMNGGMMGFGFGIISFVVQLLFLAAIIFLIFIAIKKLNLQDHQKGSNNDNSLQILKERYAKGEINEDEYKKMKDILNH